MVFANRIAAFLWGFALVWLLMLILFTRLLVRDGPPDGTTFEFMWAIIALFWIGGIALASYALDKPCYFVSVEPDGQVKFTWQYPHRRVRSRIATAQLSPPHVVETEDDEGNPYFVARLDLPDGRAFRLAEGHDRARCEQACARFAGAVDARTS